MRMVIYEEKFMLLLMTFNFSMNISTSEEKLLELLHIIQSFDPPGIGARNLQECLLLQLERKVDKRESIVNATEIVRAHMDAFSKKHYSKISRSMHLSDEDLKAAIDEILKLNPRPGNTFADSRRSVQHIVPDFIISIKDGKLDVQLNSRNVPDLKVSRSYVDMLTDYSKSKKKGKQEREAIQFVKHKLDSAKWFHRCDQAKATDTYVNDASNYEYSGRVFPGR